MKKKSCGRHDNIRSETNEDMGKHERGTPKDIANRIKSKGLQKLRWFCQMCQKQCRDQNGFKCHLTSESHQRQLLLVAENTNSFLRQFSKEFEGNFMQKLESVDQDAFCLNLRISEGPMNGRTVRVPYEDASKLA
ncbi:hypothetical protein TELCIR_10640 [Teladorsagia circumcincta]|uniref:DNA/RNA-binding protein Kin17 WH-like domain-containing protein n=1 Tax=Teladorsagia circumcincta TaxID=45464 RepID=A0A2G9UBK4_TELCI|nr:hypothetical protein TELCIR_10640 [Teladorsagia circumcincta]